VATCSDDVTERCDVEADINGVLVEDGDVVQLVVSGRKKQKVTTVLVLAGYGSRPAISPPR
jgi:hypothetical protein